MRLLQGLGCGQLLFSFCHTVINIVFFDAGSFSVYHSMKGQYTPSGVYDFIKIPQRLIKENMVTGLSYLYL